jgi:hypothetical protein
MSVFYVDLVLAVWLLVAAFALGHTPLSATINVLVAIAVGVVAGVALKKPATRYVNSGITLILVALAVLLPSLSVAARINTAIVGLVLLALTAVSPVATTWSRAGLWPGGPASSGPGLTIACQGSVGEVIGPARVEEDLLPCRLCVALEGSDGARSRDARRHGFRAALLGECGGTRCAPRSLSRALRS